MTNRCVVRAGCMLVFLLVGQTSGQTPGVQPAVPYPDYLPNPDLLHSPDIPLSPLEHVADAIVVLVPDAEFALSRPEAFERPIHGSVMRLEKGAMPSTIVLNRNSFTTPLRAGVPVRLFLAKFKDRDAYYIIGVDSRPDAGKR